MCRRLMRRAAGPVVLTVAFCLSAIPARAQQAAPEANGAEETGGMLPERPACFRRRAPAPAPCAPAAPPSMVPAPNFDPNAAPNLNPNPAQNADAAASPSFGDLASGAGVGSNVALAPGGYLDNPYPKSMFRIRYDYGFDMNRPDRAEYFYSAWREISFHPHGIQGQPGTFQGNGAHGLDPLPGKLDYQEVSSYLEWAATCRTSVFMEVPFRVLSLSNLFRDQPEDDFRTFPEPGGNDPHESRELTQTNAGGLGDIILGFKVALVAEADRCLTFQLRAFFPSGDPRNGAGTGHYSIEPGLLHYRRLSERLSYQSQFKAWFPIGGTRDVNDGRSFAGNILIYGAGLGYDLVQRPNFRFTPIAEVVGWTVLNGFESLFGSGFNQFGGVPDNHGIADVGGTTIVNAKLGVRAFFGSNDDVYVGFGQAVTSERWYKEIIRVEYRRSW